MSMPFLKLSLSEFAEVLREFRFKRQINAVHMHHTWRPNRDQYRGHESIVAMWRYHTQTNHWGDIGQHITIGPDGSIWTGRDWNAPPASAKGHNGNLVAGPFMFEMIGDFDHGRDPFDGVQRDTALRVIALVQKRFELPPESLRFHRQMADKTCPGSAIDYQDVLGAVATLHHDPNLLALAAMQRAPLVSNRMADLAAAVGRAAVADPGDAEPADEDMSIEDIDSLLSAERSGSGRGGNLRRELSSAARDALRSHVINMNLGQFSSEGQFATTPEDVDVIFRQELPKAMEAAKARKEPLRIVLYAHGGLVSESAGLQIARKHVDWWRRNNVYPIYFVWETGFMETIRQLLTNSRDKVREATPRDIWDYSTDPVLEALARTLQGPVIWGGMKHSAALASEQSGGAFYVATRLKEFCKDVGKREDGVEVQLHAMGHSAGSIFHAFFVPAALNLGVPGFSSLQFLAPAVRVDTFKSLLSARVGAGKGIDYLTLYTMRKDPEADDNCAGLYRKSLLYLIHYALEAEKKTPILGLDISLRADADLRKLFGLDGRPSKSAEVVWSVTAPTEGRSASTSQSHGGFDDDAPTMNSALRRILGLDDNDPIVAYTAQEERGGRDLRSWFDQVDLPEELRFRPPEGASAKPQPDSLRPGSTLTVESPTPVNVTSAGTRVGRRRALCVGINRYPTSPLSGCVADAQSWAATLTGLGFEPPILLLDEDATRIAIQEKLRALVLASQPGDVVVFQYAGHGTQFRDTNGDETGPDSDPDDEAVCPIDFAEGHFLVDDDLGEIFDRIPDGVNVTCFMDCCHSGTITRFVRGLTPGASMSRGIDDRPRFIAATPEMTAAHRRFRSAMGPRALRARGGPSLMKETLFAAALDSEVAWESNGHGEFTVHATQILRGGVVGLSQGEFVAQVKAAFGKVPRQHPEIYGPTGAESRPLFGSLGSPSGT